VRVAESWSISNTYVNSWLAVLALHAMHVRHYRVAALLIMIMMMMMMMMCCCLVGTLDDDGRSG
jgi:hypothetical protein